MAAIFPFLPVAARLPAIIYSLVSEFLDGFLARRWNAVSPLGQALDPIADKAFVFSTIFVLIRSHQLSWLQFSLLAMRDIVVAIGSLSVMIESRQSAMVFLHPRASGKIATALQFTLLVALYAVEGGIRQPLVYLLYAMTAVASCVSALDYLYEVLHRRFDVTGLRSERRRRSA